MGSTKNRNFFVGFREFDRRGEEGGSLVAEKLGGLGEKRELFFIFIIRERERERIACDRIMKR